ERLPHEGTLAGRGGVARENSFGPGAPAGPRYHHYVFELYALSKMLDLPSDATRAQLLDAMKDIIVGKAAYVGRFHQWPESAASISLLTENSMRTRIVGIIIFVGLASPAALAQNNVDTVVTNGKILTVDADFRIVQALAIRSEE